MDAEAQSWGPAAGGRPRQMVVLIHGYGATGADLLGLAPAWGAALPEAVFVAPDAPDPCEESPLGRQWFPIRDRTLGALGGFVRAAAERFDPALDALLARHGLEPGACALMGFSQGAMLALRVGLARARPPAAVLAYAGALLGWERLHAEIRARPPVLLVHGEADDVVPAAASHLAESELRGAGVPVQALYLPRLGHELDEAGASAGALFLQRAFGPPMTSG